MSAAEAGMTDFAVPQPIKGWVVLAAPVLGTLIFAALLGAAYLAFVHLNPGSDIETLRTLSRSR
jgi:hypothetical protein